MATDSRPEGDDLSSGVDDDVRLSSLARLVDLERYKEFLSLRGLLDERLTSTELIRHFLLEGRFLGALDCSLAWKCRKENSEISWSEARQKVRCNGLVSIVMPVYNQLRLTKQAAEAVIANTDGSDFELILVDNGSGSETQAALIAICDEHPQVRLLQLRENKFFALGSNLGFAEADGEFIVFLNNDTTVQRGWLEPLINALNERDVFASQPQLTYADGTLQCMGVVFSGRSPLGYPIYRGFPGNHENVVRARRFQAVTAACMAIRAELFAEMEGFDPIYINGQEDVDLCLRIGKRTGKRAIYVPESRVTHHESRSKGRFLHVPANRRIFSHRWSGVVRADDADYYREDGLKIRSWVSLSQRRADIAIYEPVFEGFESISLAEQRFSSKLKRANTAFRAGDYELADRLYREYGEECSKKRDLVDINLALTRKRLQESGDADQAILSNGGQ